MNMKQALIFLLLQTFFFPPSAPAEGSEPGTLCIAIDSKPAILSEENRNRIESGLCSSPGRFRLSPEASRDMAPEILYAVAMNDIRLMDEKLKTRDAQRLLYSLHSQNGDLVIHGTYLYDRESGLSVEGPKTYDLPGSLRNANETWASDSARGALVALDARRLVDKISQGGGMAAAQTAWILLHPEKATQFIRPQGAYRADDILLVRAIIARETEDGDAVRDAALAALEFLADNDEEALKRFDRYALKIPGTSADIMRVNMLNSMHRYAEAEKAAREADGRLGFELFVFSRAIALAGLGRKDDAAAYLGKFKARTGPDWEQPVIDVMRAYAQNGDEKNLKNLSETFLSLSPQEKNRDFVKGLVSGLP